MLKVYLDWIFLLICLYFVLLWFLLLLCMLLVVRYVVLIKKKKKTTKNFENEKVYKSNLKILFGRNYMIPRFQPM